MNKILTNKLFVILCLFITLVCFITTSSFAVSTITSGNEQITMSDLSASYKYHLVYRSYTLMDSGMYSIVNILVSSNTPIIVEEFETGRYRVLCDNGNYYYVRAHQGSSYSLEGKLNLDYSTSTNVAIIPDDTAVRLTFYKYENENEFYYANYDVLDTSGNVVFPSAPLGTQLPQIVEQVETEKTLAEIMGILPIVMIIVVSLIGLRKALSLLKTLLHSA